MLNEYEFSKAEKINMTLNDKVQVAETTTGTSTSTNTTWHCPYTQSKAEQGWECPRCGRINAPWVRQCDCSRNNWTITSDWTYKPEWWKEITCNSDTFKVHPDSTVYQVGGSDYKVGDTYVNVGGTQSNKVDPNVTAWNCTNPNNCHTPHYTTETVVTDGIHNFYNLKTPKEIK